MPALLDALRGRMKQREMNAIDTVAAAARAAARGEAYDVAAIEAALVETRLSMDDFEKAVDLAGKRIAWLRDFDKLATATTKVKKLESAIAAEQSKFEATRKAYHEKVGALDADRAKATKDRDAGELARGSLLDPANIPGTIGEKYREAVAAAEEAEVEIGRLRRDLREAVARIKSEEEWIEQLTGEAAEEGSSFLQVVPLVRPPESLKVGEHRRTLARAQRRKGEIEAALNQAEHAAAKARAAVEALVPEALKA